MHRLRPMGEDLCFPSLQVSIYINYLEFFCVLVSKSCHNKLPLTGWLKTTEMYSLRVLESGSLRSKCWQGHVSSEGSEKDSFPALFSFWWPQALLDLR